jgi:hypothetical protein
MNGSEDVTMTGTVADVDTQITDWPADRPLSEWMNAPRMAIAMSKDGCGADVYTNAQAAGLLSNASRTAIEELRSLTYASTTNPWDPQYSAALTNVWYDRLGKAMIGIQSQLQSEGSDIRLHFIHHAEAKRLMRKQNEAKTSGSSLTASSAGDDGVSGSKRRRVPDFS